MILLLVFDNLNARMVRHLVQELYVFIGTLIYVDT
jgi:hypothetical protein